MHTLYIGNKNYSSWSLRPWILMKALNIPFEEKLFPFTATPTQTQFLEFSPTATVPCLQDGEISVWDSLAIVEYLAEKYEIVWPQNKVARNWARCATAEMHSGFSALRNDCPMSCGVRVKLNSISPALQKNIDRINALWEQGLTLYGGPFLAGERFTAVDAFFAPVVFRAVTFSLELNEASQKYVDHMMTFAPMKEWYDATLQETWRDEPHEEEIVQTGTLLQDFRQTR